MCKEKAGKLACCSNETVDAHSIPVSCETKNSRKLIFTASLNMMLDIKQHKGCVKTKPTSLLVNSLGKALT